MSTEHTSAKLSEDDRRRIDAAAQGVVNIRIIAELRRLIGQWKEEDRFRRRALVLLLPVAGVLLVLLVLLVFLIAGLARPSKPIHPPVIATAATISPLLAGYVDAWRAKAEKALAGACPSLVPNSVNASTSILSDGRIEKVEIERGSGVAAFDKAVNLALTSVAPLQPFSPEMRAKMDVLVVTTTITVSPEWCKSR
jgi:hypothetical protein